MKPISVDIKRITPNWPYLYVPEQKWQYVVGNVACSVHYNICSLMPPPFIDGVYRRIIAEVIK